MKTATKTEIKAEFGQEENVNAVGMTYRQYSDRRPSEGFEAKYR